jgi:hypothetical protein
MGGMSDKKHTALSEPPHSLTAFPSWRLAPGRPVYRAHREGRSPWWFCSDLECRFDVPEPQGTCHVALDPLSAVQERLGDRLAASHIVTLSVLEGFVVSRLETPVELNLADTCHSDAESFGITHEIATLTPYELPQQWACAFLDAGFAGVRFKARFSHNDAPNAAALFGSAGGAEWPDDPEPTPMEMVAHDAGIAVVTAPALAELRLIEPPPARRA